MRSNRFVSWFGLLSLVVFLIAGCTTAETTPTQQATQPTETMPAPPTNSPATESPRFDGVTITVLTYDGPQIAEPLKRHAPEFEQLTGATVNVVTVPFDKIYQSIMIDFKQGTTQYDVAVYAPQWMVDYAMENYLEDLTDRIASDSAMEWDDIAPFFRNVSVAYNGRTYAIPLDGDFQMVYYRSDLLQEAGLDPPATWDDYIAIAKQLHGQDMNNDGTPDFGSCITTKPSDQAYHMVWSVASAFIQTQGTQQGAFFDTETMQPLVHNEALAVVLDIFKESATYGPPDELQSGLPDIRSLFTSGRCALTLDWGDIGTLAIDAETSRVVDKVGAVILPGSTRVLDRETGKLVDCDKTTCPYAIDGINHAPYAAFGGWSGSINAASDPARKDAAYAFLSYVSQPAQSNQDVTIGATGFNPYRISQFTNRDAWLAAGMSEEAASKYLGAIGVSLNSPNVVLDLRIPQNQRYQEVVLDTALEKFLSDEMSKEETMEYIFTEWEAITDNVGRDTQRETYKSSLGILK